MIEAVNSSLSNASVLRAPAEQTSTQRSLTSNPARIQETAETPIDVPKAPYISPYVVVDLDHNKAVLQIRDSDTGDVLTQFPSESRLQAIRAQTIREGQQTTRSEASEETSTAAQEVVSQSSAPAQSASTSDIITVQEVTSAPPANSSPQVAAAALAASQSTGASSNGSVSVLA